MADEQIEKVKTAFPGLQQASGVKPENMEVVKPSPEGAQAAASAPKPEPAKTETKAEAPAEKQKINLDELSDEDVNAILAKRSKGKINSIDDLDSLVNPVKPKSTEEIEAEKQKRKTDALAWAFENGKLKKDEYEKAIVEKSKTDRELALAVFTANLQSEDKNVTIEEAEEIFRDAYHEDAEADSKLFKVGQKEMKNLAESYRKEKFSALDQVEPDYDNFTQTQDQYKSYKGVVKKAIAELPTELTFGVPYKDLNGVESTIDCKIAVDPKVIAKLTADYTDQKAFLMRNMSAEGKFDEADMRKELEYHMKAMTFDKAIPELLKAHGEEVEKRLMVELGNKKNGAQPLNNGQQNTAGSGAVKTNTYPGLHQHMDKQRN